MRPRAGAGGITVAIATMDRPLALARCVRALLDGIVRPSQLVIVDQSGDPRTAELVAASGWDADVPLTFIRQPRQGLAASRNAAIARSRCPVIAFTDDDCVPDAGWVAALARAFASGDPAAVTGRVLPLGPDQPGRYAVSTRASVVPRTYLGRSLPWLVGTGGNAAVAREWLDRIGGFDERLGAGAPGLAAEDMDLFYRLLRAGGRVCYEPAALIRHERKDGTHRRASRRTYGFGMGAFCGLWLRRFDVYAIWILLRWSVDRAVLLAAAALRARGRRLREEWAMLRGAAAGLAFGVRGGP